MVAVTGVYHIWSLHLQVIQKQSSVSTYTYHFTKYTWSADLWLLRRPLTFWKYSSTHNRACLEILEISLWISTFILAKNWDCSNKFYLSLCATINKHVNSNLEIKEATTGRLLTICWIPLLGQSLKSLLCGPWHYPEWSRYCAFFFFCWLPEV
jgi:hypothetical protein